ncbi:hypothetical protein GmHk_19G054901 [Glycine max]|nr:hypothetical protein GmHk_19G054901 [Glycine max]
MSPPPLEAHNHSQTHLKLSGRLPLQASFSVGGLVGACALCATLARLARISEFRLSARLLTQWMDSSSALSRISPHSVNMHNSSFFQILPRAQPQEWCIQRRLAEPTDWLSE